MKSDAQPKYTRPLSHAELFIANLDAAIERHRRIGSFHAYTALTETRNAFAEANAALIVKAVNNHAETRKLADEVTRLERQNGAMRNAINDILSQEREMLTEQMPHEMRALDAAMAPQPKGGSQ